MSRNEATLHLLCGKIAAGKSTLSAELAQRPATVVISEDHWLSRLYRDEMKSVSDYLRCSARLREAMRSHLVALLQAGVSIVLDFPANTPGQRAWMRTIFEQAQSAHQLHFLDVPDAICKARLRARNASGDHDFAATDEEFEQITSYFVAPTPEEGFNLVRHAP